MNIKNNRELLDDLLIELIEKCQNLSFIQFNGVIRNINTIKKICEIQNNTQNRKLIASSLNLLNKKMAEV